MDGVERLQPARLRWRLRGAWQWPAFLVLTVVDAVLLNELPISGDGPGGLVPGLLLAGFANLFCVAALAPLIGRRLRRRRPDLPRVVADDYAGTTLLCALAVALVAGGLIHRPQVLAEREAVRAQAAAVHDYVASQGAAEYRAGLAMADTIRLADGVYRTCVPGSDPKRWLCLIVDTSQRPAGVTRDSDAAPNGAYGRAAE